MILLRSNSDPNPASPPAGAWLLHRLSIRLNAANFFVDSSGIFIVSGLSGPVSNAFRSEQGELHVCASN